MPRANLKHEQLAALFRTQLLNGELQAGDRLPSVAEVRERYGASRPTVERAHALLEKEGLVVRRHSAGAFVATAKRQQIRGIIGLSGRGFGVGQHSPYWSHLLGGVRDAATQQGIQVLLLDPASSQGWEKVDGVLVCDWNDARVPRKDLPGLPLVSLLTPIEGVASVVADDYAGMQTAIEYLLTLGHRKIAYLHGHLSSPVAWNRSNAYRETLKAARVRLARGWKRVLPERYDYGSNISRAAHMEMARWLKEGWKELGCTALLCHNDDCALGAIQALTEAGIRVPHDVSVMGFDGTELCDLVTPPLSSIQVPLRAIGESAVELLEQQISMNKVSDEHRTLPIGLQTRASTDALSLK